MWGKSEEKILGEVKNFFLTIEMLTPRNWTYCDVDVVPDDPANAHEPIVSTMNFFRMVIVT